MSSSNASTDLILSLNNASNSLNSYLSIFIYIFGIVGNFLNVLVLSQRALRSNPSATFFLVSSIFGLIVILSGLTSRMMSGYAVDLTLTVGWICKLRNILLYSARTIVLWMIVLATIDRWLSSSVRVYFRQMSNFKNVRRSMLVVLLYTCLINAPILYCYEANLTGTLRGCYGSTYACRLTTDLIYAFGTTLSSLVLMFIFGLLTIRNVYHARSRVQAVNGSVLSRANRHTAANTSGQQQTKKRDRHLLKMLLVQITLLIVFTCPHAIEKVYSSFATSPSPQSLESAVQNIVFTVFTLLTYTASGMPFYIYTLTGGSAFRNVLFSLKKRIVEKILCSNV